MSVLLRLFLSDARRWFVTGLLLNLVSVGWAGDWPQWRGDAGHTASTAEGLPNQLALRWTRHYTARRQAWDDPLNHDVMQYDRVFEPVVSQGRMFVPFNDADKVVALDVTTGSEIWSFYADGPVRFAPVVWKDAVMFASDDGHLYSVGAADGKLRWRFRGAPGARKIIGNRRVISAWPARGGPVVQDNQVFFAASIWPFMGTFIYCLDAETGDIVWVNDSTSAQYIKQPHSAPSFAGVAPQGTMTVVGDVLLVPGGRSVPAAFDRKDGKLLHFELNAGGKGNGGSFVCGRDEDFYLHTRERGVRAFGLRSGTKTAFMINEPVLSSQQIFAAEGTEKLRAYDTKKKQVWELSGVDGSGDLIRAGERLYAAGGEKLTAVQLSPAKKTPEIVWQVPTAPDVVRLLAASDMLFAVTLDGRILAYGNADSADSATAGAELKTEGDLEPVDATVEATQTAVAIAQQVGQRAGVALCYGVEPALLRALVTESEYQIIAVDERKEVVALLRREFDQAGCYGDRVSVHVGDIESFAAPPYIANVVLLGSRVRAALEGDPQLLRTVFDTVRPYGGCLVATDVVDQEAWGSLVKRSEIEQASVEGKGPLLVVRRVGALPGAADWTHQYGDIANTVKSNDRRVKPPLGLLWFGGSSNLDVLPRHSHSPPEQVIGGRLYVEGMNSLSCRDVYTGRVLWKREFENLGTFGVYFDTTYKDTPLSTAYNQVHIPGANGRGTNYVATEDAIYLAIGNACQVLNPVTGETEQKLTLPADAKGKNREWGFIGVYQDVLLGGMGFANYRAEHKLDFATTDEKLSKNAKGFGSQSLDRSASQALVAFDRQTGEILWQLDSRHSFLHNGIVAGDGTVFCLDKLQKPIEDKLKRRGKNPPDTYRIVAVDVKTGEPVWEETGGIFGTWLGYSTQHGLLLQAGARASDRLKSEVGEGMAVYRGRDGEVVWRVNNRQYSGPCILHNDTILTNANSYQLSSGAFSLLDGTPKLIVNPLTQQEEPWKICRAYGCNNIIASENMLTFRSGAAGFYDMQTMSGTGNLGGFKSGCTSNLVVANGVLNAPDYTRTCSCGYQNQTSLALIHMPEMDMWTVNHTARLTKPGQAIERLGVNFGAPGDRVASDGTLWLDYPFVGGESATIDIQVEGNADYHHHHTLKYAGPGIPWVGASGVSRAAAITIPLQIQAAPLTFAVQHADDDAAELADGTVVLAGKKLMLVGEPKPSGKEPKPSGKEPKPSGEGPNAANQTQVGEAATTKVVGVRFDQVELPRGSRVRKAYVQFTSGEVSEQKSTLSLALEASDDARRFDAVEHNLSERPVTQETVRWRPAAWKKEGRAGDTEQTPDLSALVQQVIDRPNWKRGNALALLLRGRGPRVAKAHDASSAAAARLVIEADVPQDTSDKHPYLVRLYFAEPEAKGVGDRVFRVLLNGQVVEPRFDILEHAEQPRQTIVREYNDVLVADRLEIKLEALVGETLICGVEIVRQQEK